MTRHLAEFYNSNQIQRMHLTHVDNFIHIDNFKKFIF